MPDNQHKETFETYSHFKNAKEILIATEGFDAASLAKIKTIEEHLNRSNLLTLESAIAPNPTRMHYSQTNMFYLKDLNTNQTQSIREKLEALYAKMMNNPYYTAIDANDPLGYFTPKSQSIDMRIINGHLALGDYGYLSVFSLKDTSNSLESYKKVYTRVHEELQDSDNVRVFSPTFYFVENSQKIKNDVSFLVVLSTIVLLLLYFFIIKNMALLFNTIATLITSTLLAFMLTSLFWGEISVFVLAFGNAIGTLAIDYMFHYYFHGYYEQKKRFNTSVFYGFVTTFGGFFIFSWIDFPLIQQVCTFAMISLLLSYLQFVFLFPIIGFQKAHPFTRWSVSLPLPYRAISLISLVAILFTIPFLKIDTDIKKLDYQNTALMGEEKFFTKNLKKEGYSPILIEADSIDELIANSNTIVKNFEKATVPLSYVFEQKFYEQRKKEIANLDLEAKKAQIEQEATALGFRKGFFSNAYSEALLFPSYQPLDEITLSHMGLDILHQKGKYFTHGLVQSTHINLLKKFNYVHFIDAKEMFFNALQNIMHQLLLGGALSIGLIVSILLLTCSKTLSLSASYVLLPPSLILLFLGLNAFSVLHVFMLFIVMAFGIDYGIYMGRAKHLHSETRSAILVSLLSTFAGFGVLVFSDIGALHSMGLVSCIGTGAILFLLMGRTSR